MEGEGNNDRWLLTYSDLITLLMVFFVVLYAISEADKGKFIQLRSSLQRAFNGDLPVRGNGPAVYDTPVPLPTGTPLEQIITYVTPTATPAPTPRVDVRLIDQLREALVPLAASQGADQDVNVYENDGSIVISLSGGLLFDSGKAELRPEGAAYLHAAAGVLRGRPNSLRVEGHTDNVAISTALYPSNWELSAARAVIATRYLVEQENLPAATVMAAACGDSRPVADNSTRQGRTRNRRVDILVLDAGPAPASASPDESGER
jgi:chemotaxis protein MotB